MLISISGLPGSGTSSVSRAVAERLGLDHLDGGSVFRAMAAEQGLDLASFGAMAEADDTIDLELDARLAERARQGGVVLESRLSGWILANERIGGLRVWIACDPVERARRVGHREGLGEADAARSNEAREASESARYRAYYGIDLADLAPYHLVLDSTSTSVGGLVERIVAAAAMHGAHGPKG